MVKFYIIIVVLIILIYYYQSIQTYMFNQSEIMILSMIIFSIKSVIRLLKYTINHRFDDLKLV